ncbi:trypsin-like serine protease [Kribbella sp. NPDC056861]|uniref:trypsin-like serine protease n=1 Tax=Kribbella sp. NPDC056861 TaxID=3154857 RepID=UPI003441DA41
MRRNVLPTAAVALLIMAVAAPAQGLPGPVATPDSKPSRAVGIESLSPADQASQLAQAPLLELLNRIRDLEPKAYETQYAGAEVDAKRKTLTLHWAGAVPAGLTRLRSKTAEGVVLDVKPARFSQRQLMTAAQRVMPGGESNGTVSLAVDGSGLTVAAGNLPAIGRGTARASVAEAALLQRVAAVRTSGVPVTLAAARPGTTQFASRQADSSPYWAGARIDMLGDTCTSGFSMYASAIPGNRFTLTAAHCVSYSDGVRVDNGAGVRMGQSDFVGRLYGQNSYDLGTVRLDAGRSNAPSIYVGENAYDGTIPVSGYASAGVPAGGNYCVHGMTAVNCNVRSGAQEWVCADRCFWNIAMTAWDGTNIIWCRGDSGGPIYYWTGNTVIAAGVVSTLRGPVGTVCSRIGGASVVATAVNLVDGLRVVTTSAP